MFVSSDPLFSVLETNKLHGGGGGGGQGGGRGWGRKVLAVWRVRQQSLLVGVDKFYCR